jgi:hypothetical protein
MLMRGDEIEQLTNLTGQYYAVEELERLVRFKCNRNLKSIDDFKNYTSGIFNLLRDAEQTDWLLDLVKALADGRPTVTQFLQIYNDLKREKASDFPAGQNAKAGAARISARESALFGDWFGAQMQGTGPKGGPISYPIRLQIQSVSPEVSGIFRFSFISDEASLNESLDFKGSLIQGRFAQLSYCDEKSGKVQLGVQLLELSDDGCELKGYDVGYGYSSKQIATARTVLRKQSIIIDPFLDLIQKGSVPQKWATRAAFIHSGAATYWQGSNTPLENESRAIEAYISLLAADGAWDLMVSLGPGDVTVDRKLVAALGARIKRYVPVDISQGICKAAVHSIGALCPVPLGIAADLEGGTGFVSGALKQLDPGRLLVICTGNLIGNLDSGEANLIKNLVTLTRPEDSVLLSVATGRFSEPADRATLEPAIRLDDLKDLISYGLENITGQDWQTIRGELDDRLAVRAGASDVPGSSTRELYDQRSNRTALVLRRYDFAKFVDWIRPKFPSSSVQSLETSTSNPNVGIGCLALKRV